MQRAVIRTVAVAGGGIAGLSAATAFARSLCGTSVTLIDTGVHPGAVVDVVPSTWPSISRFHRSIGLDEIELVRSGVATHHLGTMFHNWSSTGEPWVHAFGSYGKSAGGIPFDQIWYRAKRAGEALSYDCYSPGAALARAGKFVHPTGPADFVGSRFQYGLSLDPEAYRERLRDQAASSDVASVTGEIERVERSRERIAAVVLSDGRAVEADLFIDCTGPDARILSALDDSFEDWGAWIPFDRLVLTAGEGRNVPRTADRVRVRDEGWDLEWDLPGRTRHASLRIGGDGVSITRGRRLRPWVSNVLAVGEAATALDPLHSLNLDVAHQAILLALELLPRSDFNPLETAEYNRRAEQLTRRVRDFVALHYLRCGRSSGVWRSFAEREPPDSLARTLDQYGYRGRLPFHEEESVSRDSWTAALLGLGILPAHVDPQSTAVPLGQAIRRMRDFAREIDDAVAALPPYVDYLRATTR